VGKNVCHTVPYNRDIHNIITSVPAKNRAAQLFREGMDMYLAKHDHKLFHDPTAAACHLHPEIGTWVSGTLYRENGGWGTRIGGHDQMLVDVSRDRLWQCWTNSQ
jgi:inosine-uridine nucleoside N-ribohydrolase